MNADRVFCTFATVSNLKSGYSNIAHYLLVCMIGQ